MSDRMQSDFDAETTFMFAPLVPRMVLELTASVGLRTPRSSSTRLNLPRIPRSSQHQHELRGWQRIEAEFHKLGAVRAAADEAVAAAIYLDQEVGASDNRKSRCVGFVRTCPIGRATRDKDAFHVNRPLLVTHNCSMLVSRARSLTRIASRNVCSGPLSVRSPIAASASFWVYGSAARALTLANSQSRAGRSSQIAHRRLCVFAFLCVFKVTSVSNHLAHSIQ